MKNCIHTIGYIESDGYDGSTITDFITMDSSWDDLKTLKSQKNSFSFCPYCGSNVSEILDSKIEEYAEMKKKKDKEDALKREKANVLFMNKVEMTARENKLDQLPEEGNFIVVFHPTKNSYGKDLVLTGTKDIILKNCVHYNQNKSNPDTLLVKNVFKVFSKETFSEIMVKNDWEKVGDYPRFVKTMGNKTRELTFDSDGTVYVTEKVKDSDGDVSTNYDRFTINRLGDYLNSSVELEQVVLK